MLKIGNLKLDVPFFQAPLNGYSDYAMRRLALDFKVPLTFSGVMLAKSASSAKMLRNPLFRPQDDEHPVGAQILGNDPAIMAAGAKSLQDAGYDIIDLNFACPVPKVLRRGRGGWLMREPETVIQIYRQVRDAVSCPVTMKLRAGYGKGSESYDNYYAIVYEASRLGIDALTIHGRTVLQRFTGNVDWDILADTKRQFPDTTIIGSGDLFEPVATVERLRTSGLDGLLIARGAIGNPWIYQGLHAVLAGEPIPKPPSLAEQGQVMTRHFELICRFYKPASAVRYFRKFLVRYCRRHPMRKQVQQSFLAAKDGTQLLAEIQKWYDSN